MQPAPDVLLLISPNCPHCESLLQSLSELVKQAKIGRLEIINIAVHAEAADRLGVRSLPWTRIGYFELTGNHTPDDLLKWVNRAATDTGGTDYLSELLSQQQLNRAMELVTEKPIMLQAAMELIASPETPMVTRIGVSAIIEELADTEELRSLVNQLAELTNAEESSIRADAAHYLGLSGSISAAQWLKPMLNDAHEHVREIAQDSLERLEETD